MRSLIVRPSGIHTPWNKLIMIMLKYQKQNLPSWIPIFSLTQGSWLAFFSTTASALAIEADAVLRDPRCLNERCPVLGQGSWTCCLNQLKDLRDSLVSLLEIKELLLNKLIPNITVLKNAFCLPSNESLFSLSQLETWDFFFASTDNYNLIYRSSTSKTRLALGGMAGGAPRTAIPKLGRNQQSTTFSLQHSFPQKLWRVRRTKTKGRWIFVDWFPRSSKLCRYNLPTISECTLNIPQFSTKRRHLKIHVLIFIVHLGSCIIRIFQSLPPSEV